MLSAFSENQRTKKNHGKGHKQAFLKDEIQMVSRHMKRSQDH